MPVDYPSKEDIKVATMTLCCKINCNIDVENLVKYHKLEKDKVEKIKFGSSKKKDVEEVKISSDEATKKTRKNKKKKNNFYNQVTIVIKPFQERKNGVNMKLSDNGSIQMTGATSIEEGHLTIRKMLEYLFEWSEEIFYTKETKETIKSIDVSDVSDDSNSKETYNYLKRDDVDGVKILSTDCELIIVSFALPFYIHLKKFNDILKTNYKLLSIFGTSSYPGVNTKFTYSDECQHKEHIKKKKKYMCDCRDMSIFTFRTGKVIITGFENLDKIQTIFDKYIGIIKKEEHHIKIDAMVNIQTKKATSNIMKVGDKTFEVVDSF
jgi:TATA-box binding protein (TBP) (component of TFIID and TFIIIB)